MHKKAALKALKKLVF